MRTAIVGTGAIARAHAQAIAALSDRLELVAAVDTDPTRLKDFQEQHGIPHGYPDTAEMLKEQRPDIVQICSPPGTHVDLSIACLEAGAWVLCEKPLAGSLADLDRIQLTEQQTGGYVSSVAQWRFGSGGQHLKGLVARQTMGRPLVGVCNTLWYRPADYYAVPWRGRWDTELGGVSMCLGVHIMDLLLYLLGDWTTIRATMATLERDIENENVSLADASDAERQAFAAWSALPDEVATSQTSQLRAMLDDMQASRRPLVSSAPVRGTIEFLISLYMSACTGETVQRGSITPDDPFYSGMANVFARKEV